MGPEGKLVNPDKQVEWGTQEGYITFYLLVQLLFIQTTLSDKKIFHSYWGGSENSHKNQ